MAILTCKQTCECISLQIFSKYPIQKSRDRTPPPDLPTLKAYPTPGVGGRFGFLSLKWRERVNLKVPGAILPLGCAILSTRAKPVRGVGTTLLRRTRVKSYGTLFFPKISGLTPTLMLQHIKCEEDLSTGSLWKRKVDTLYKRHQMTPNHYGIAEKYLLPLNANDPQNDKTDNKALLKLS